jgi:predicted HicB family RNase H-like nuclease
MNRDPEIKRKRPQIGIIVTKETKEIIEQMAQESGQSMGQTVEQLIHEALHTRRILNALGYYQPVVRRPK